MPVSPEYTTAAEKLDVPHYVLKKPANHISSSDVTESYIVVDVERVRTYMARISDHFLTLMGATKDDFIYLQEVQFYT